MKRIAEEIAEYLETKLHTRFTVEDICGTGYTLEARGVSVYVGQGLVFDDKHDIQLVSPWTSFTSDDCLYVLLLKGNRKPILVNKESSLEFIGVTVRNLMDVRAERHYTDEEWDELWSGVSDSDCWTRVSAVLEKIPVYAKASEKSKVRVRSWYDNGLISVSDIKNVARANDLPIFFVSSLRKVATKR